MAKATLAEKKKQADIDWTDQKPWGPLGADLPKNASLEEILKAAKLNWKVERATLYAKHSTHKSITAADEVSGFAALMRSDNKKVLDICGSQYKPVQNEDSFKFFKRFVEAGKAKLTEAGELSGGRLVWAMADLNNEFTIGKNDVVKCKLLLASPHEQGKSFKISMLAHRLVCSNGLTRDVTEGYFRMSHKLTFDEMMMEKAATVLGLANDSFDKMATLVQAMAKKKVTRPKGLVYLAQVFDPELGNAPPDEILEKGNKSTKLAIEALDNAPGHNLLGSEGTAWGLLNAITYTTDHLLGHTLDARLRKAWFGKTAALKQRAFDLATKL